MPIQIDLDMYSFDLPSERIALRPVEPRETARVLVVHSDGTLEDKRVADLPNLLGASDLLVTNTTRVLPASLKAVRKARDETGRDVTIQINLVKRDSTSTWLGLVKPARRLKRGDILHFSDNLTAEVTSDGVAGQFSLRFNQTGTMLDSSIETLGTMPIPPYIAKNRASDINDKADYQSVFAKGQAESVAAPTASLHFTPDLLAQLAARGITRTEVCLHVGMGTFAPLTDVNLETGRLHEEWRSLSQETVDTITNTQAQNGRVIAIGSTAMRTLESCVMDGTLCPQTGPTDIFIQPGYEFQICTAMLTNFHLPGSSLFMLVCAFMGRDIMQNAYAHAIKHDYRFYSYGDACLLLP